MKLITEDKIEIFAIELLEKQGYQYVYAPDIAPDSETPERARFEDVFLLERLRKAVGRINPSIPADVREDAIKQIQRLNSPELIANNETFHRMLTEGIKVSYQKDGADRGDLVWLIDFNNPENNEFLVANQFTVIENNIEKTDVNTPAVFGNYVDVYDISKAVEDGATVKIYYESRLAKIALSEEGKKLVAELDEELESEDLAETQKAKAKWTQLEALIGSEDRIRQVAQDIITHFEQRQVVFEGKGIIVAMSRRIAADLYDEIIKNKPQWHNDDLKKGCYQSCNDLCIF
ncbi:HsdR family type I site-specificdeoxyribonuclease [groundwater metagenome]